MSEDNGVSMPTCPIEFKACYLSFECQDCMFWRNDKCDYEITMASEESVAQLATVYPELSKPQLRSLARFAEFLKKGAE